MNAKILLRLTFWGDFPGGLVVKTLSSKAGVLVWSLFEELSKIPHALWQKKKKQQQQQKTTHQNQNTKQKQYCNKFNKDFKMVHIKSEIFFKKKVFQISKGKRDCPINDIGTAP